MVDSTLTWNIHIDKIYNTISRATGSLYKIRPFVNNKILRMLYQSCLPSFKLCNRSLGFC